MLIWIIFISKISYWIHLTDEFQNYFYIYEYLNNMASCCTGNSSKGPTDNDVGWLMRTIKHIMHRVYKSVSLNIWKMCFILK